MFKPRFFVYIFIFALFFNIDGFAKSYFHGSISQDMRWTGDIYIDGDVTIPRGVILSVDAGSTVYLKSGVDKTNSGIDRERIEIIVEGVLLISGESGDKMVTFTSETEEPQMNDWYGIIIKNLYEASVINYAKIEYTYKGITCYGSAPKIKNSIIQYNHFAGISCEVRANPVISGCQILGNGFAGINCELASSPVISDCEISQNAYGVLIITKSRPLLGRYPVGNSESKGGNRIINNFEFNIYNHSVENIYAQNNQWNSTRSSEIRMGIYDRLNNAAFGQVFFEPIFRTRYFQRTPEIQNEAQEDDSVENEVSILQPANYDSVARNPAEKPEPPQQRNTKQHQKGNPLEGLLKLKETDSIFTSQNEGNNDLSQQETRVVEPLPESMLDKRTREYERKVAPNYPEIYSKTGTEGDVFIEVIVGRDGKIESHRVLRSDGELFTREAIKALKLFKYKPATYRGHPVKFKIIELFRFKKDLN